jgi:hypothetical protein
MVQKHPWKHKPFAMASIMNEFAKALMKPICEMAEWLQKEHSIPVKDTIDKWNELSGMKVVLNDDATYQCQEEPAVEVNLHQEEDVKVMVRQGLCKHVFAVGKRKGQRCPTKPKCGNDYCSSHKKKEVKAASSSDSEKNAVKAASSSDSEKKEAKASTSASKKNRRKAPTKITSKSSCDSSDDELQAPGREPTTRRKAHTFSDSDSD